jgi:hypothetical protein
MSFELLLPVMATLAAPMLFAIRDLYQAFRGRRGRQSMDREVRDAIARQVESQVEPDNANDAPSEVDATFAEARARLDSTMELILSLRDALGADLDRVRKQVEEQQEALEALRAEAAQREEFLEISKSDVLIVEMLGAKIEDQRGEIKLLAGLLEKMELRATRAERRATRLAWVTFGLSTLLAVGTFAWQVMAGLPLGRAFGCVELVRSERAKVAEGVELGDLCAIVAAQRGRPVNTLHGPSCGGGSS